MLWRGTWHALTRFPATPGGAGFAFLTDANTQRELEQQRADGTPPKLTQEIDYRQLQGGRPRRPARRRGRCVNRRRAGAPKVPG
jgi:hypothetical protein